MMLGVVLEVGLVVRERRKERCFSRSASMRERARAEMGRGVEARRGFGEEGAKMGGVLERFEDLGGGRDIFEALVGVEEL